MAVVTIISPATFEEVSPDGYGTCCGMVPTVQRVQQRNRRGLVWIVVNCSNPECEFHADGSGVFAMDCDIRAKWEKYRKA